MNPIVLLLTSRSAVGRLSFHLAANGLPLNRTGAPVKQFGLCTVAMREDVLYGSAKRRVWRYHGV
jgi:hypothetical protein